MVSDSGSAENTTYAAISEGDIDIRSNPGMSLDQLKTSREDAHQVLDRIFNEDMVEAAQESTEAQQMLSNEIPHAIGEYASNKTAEADLLELQALNENDPDKQAELRAQATEIRDNWGEEGTYRVALHTLSGAISGNLQGAAGAYLVASNVDTLASALDDMNVSDTVKDSILLATSLAAGAATNGGTGALNTVGQTANNYLKHQEIADFAQELRDCADSACQLDVAAKYKDISNRNTAELIAACQSGDDSCGERSQEVHNSDAYQREITNSGGFARNILASFAVFDTGEQGLGTSIVLGRQLEDMGINPEVAAMSAAILGSMGRAGRNNADTNGTNNDRNGNEQAQTSGQNQTQAGTNAGERQQGHSTTDTPQQVGGPPVNPNQVTARNLTNEGNLSNLSPNDAVVLQNTARILVQDSSGRYWLQGPNGNKITPSGYYEFVTLPNGTVRVARPNANPDFSTHLGLSGGSDVKFAGSIRFTNNTSPNRGNISQWSNNSGHYRPPAELSGNAGLPTNLFSEQ